MFFFEAIRLCSSFFFSFPAENMSARRGLMKALSSSSGKMQLEGEFVTVPRKLYNHPRQAHSLLGKG